MRVGQEVTGMKRHTVVSSAVREVGFDPLRQKMEVKYTNGKTGVYDGVSEKEYEEFEASPSKGRFLASNFRGQKAFSYTDEDET